MAINPPIRRSKEPKESVNIHEITSASVRPACERKNNERDIQMSLRSTLTLARRFADKALLARFMAGEVSLLQRPATRATSAFTGLFRA